MRIKGDEEVLRLSNKFDKIKAKTFSDLIVDEKEIDNDEVMDAADMPETEAAFEDDMTAETKCAAQSEVKSVEMTSSIVKRLRQRSGKC